MGTAPDSKFNKANCKFKWLPELDRLLIVGVKHVPAAKHDAINKILKLVPQLTRGDCWRRIRPLRGTPEFAVLKKATNVINLGRGEATHSNAITRSRGRPQMTTS
jgi:hypothetical protein